MPITKMIKNTKKHNKSETSTHCQQEEEIVRGCKKKRESSLVPILPPPKLGNCEDVG